jgi:hypothetical protein
MLHNACEWIEEGETDVRVLSPTHDSASRPWVDSGKLAYFDATRMWDETGADYDETKPDKQPALESQAAGVVGTMSRDGSVLTLVDPAAKTEGFLAETLIHEVLHDADQRHGTWSEARRPTGRPDEAPPWAYDSYQTEFRAYWAENPEGSSSDHFGSSSESRVGIHTVNSMDQNGKLVSVATSFGNQRQERIWLHLRGADRPGGDWYDSTLGEWRGVYGWMPDYYALDPAFRKMVDEYDRPRNGNAICSVRVQRLSEAIGESCGEVDAESILAAVEDLDDLDRTFLADQDLSRPFWEQARRSMEVPLLREVRARVFGDETSNAAAGPDRYTVCEGDSLSLIADRMLGSQDRWTELYALNRDLLGESPDHIRPGQVLALPPA